MRILHVVPTYFPATRYGGPIYAVHGLCRGLVGRGHEVEVFTTNVDGDGVSNVPDVLDLDGVRVRYFESEFRRLYWSRGMGKALRDVSKYDVVHLHSVFLWPTFAGASAARKANVPYVISPRGMLVRELIREKSTMVKSAWIALVERRNFAHAAAIHFTSQREWDEARRVSIPLPKPVVVPNGIYLSDRPNVPRDDDTILFLGRINWKKGLDRLIQALALLPNARLLVAGNDEEDYTPRLRELAQHLGVLDRITFVGRVDGERKQELLARAAVFALPSQSENFGNAVLEAMAMATPVVVSPGVGLAEDVSRARAGAVVEADPRALANAIGELLADPVKRDEAGARGRAVVESRFRWESVAARMEEVYRACSKTSRP